MNVEALRAVVSKMLFLHSYDDDEMETCCREAKDILSNNVSDAILFFQTECTDEEFFWLSSVFEDVSALVQSKQFIQVLRARLALVTRESYDQESFKSEHMRQWVDYDEYVRSISMDIDYAEDALNNK